MEYHDAEQDYLDQAYKDYVDDMARQERIRLMSVEERLAYYEEHRRNLQIQAEANALLEMLSGKIPHNKLRRSDY